MTDQLTRLELLRRAALGGTRAHPARDPRRLRRRRRRRDAGGGTRPRRRSSRTRCASRTGRSTSTVTTKTKKSPTLEQFKQKTGHDRQLRRGHQRQRHLLREDPAPALAGPVDRPGHHRPHRQLALPGAPDQARLGREARQERDPEHRQPPGLARAPELRPRTASTACRGSRG